MMLAMSFGSDGPLSSRYDEELPEVITVCVSVQTRAESKFLFCWCLLFHDPITRMPPAFKSAVKSENKSHSKSMGFNR